MPSAPSDIRPTRITTRDGAILYGRSWNPAAHLNASIVLVHGYAEHSGRYDELGRYLSRHGYALHTYDQRGAGRSDGKRGRIHRFGLLVSDLKTFVESLPNDDAPVFIMGHSLGGAVVLEYLIRYAPNQFGGIIASSPALRIVTPFPSSTAQMIARIAPLVPFIPTLPLDRTGLSRDQSVVEEAATDDGNFLGRIPLGTAGQMISAGPKILARASQIKLPSLIFTGTADRIVDPKGSFELFAQIGSSDKTLAIYEGLYHETFREPEKAIVMDGLRLWLEEQLS